MSYENPTTLRIGVHGEFGGTDFRIVGRVVMGVEISGETYYWNEFNLEARDGTTATLVFEETDENGNGDWRLFTLFEPEYPLTAADAATKNVGDPLNLNGTDVRVTLVQTSQVYRIEGLPPEGVKVGSIANYFNAEADGLMQVVSWTGDEVEYYNGLDLSRSTVEKAFGRLFMPARNFSRHDDSYSGLLNYAGVGKFLLYFVLFVFVVFIGFGPSPSVWFGGHAASPVRKISAAAPPLTVDAHGQWDGKNYHVTAHALIEIDETSAIFERNEYTLSDDNSNLLLLVCGDQPNAKNWTLYSLLDPFSPPSPQQSAAEKPGDIVNVDGFVATVGQLFQSKIEDVGHFEPTSWQTGDTSFGYLARAEQESLLVEWSNNLNTHFYRGKMVLAKDFTAAFKH